MKFLDNTLHVKALAHLLSQSAHSLDKTPLSRRLDKDARPDRQNCVQASPFRDDYLSATSSGDLSYCQTFVFI